MIEITEIIVWAATVWLVYKIVVWMCRVTITDETCVVVKRIFGRPRVLGGGSWFLIPAVDKKLGMFRSSGKVVFEKTFYDGDEIGCAVRITFRYSVDTKFVYEGVTPETTAVKRVSGSAKEFFRKFSVFNFSRTWLNQDSVIPMTKTVSEGLIQAINGQDDCPGLHIDKIRAVSCAINDNQIKKLVEARMLYFLHTHYQETTAKLAHGKAGSEAEADEVIRASDHTPEANEDADAPHEAEFATGELAQDTGEGTGKTVIISAYVQEINND